jgi:hypothetical protein
MQSTAAGEYVALSRGNTASKCVKEILKFYGNTSPIYHIYTDNQAAEHIATQPTMNEHSRSIDIRHHAIRQDYLENKLRIGGVKSKDNTSDILTKYLQAHLHKTHTEFLHIQLNTKQTTQPQQTKVNTHSNKTNTEVDTTNTKQTRKDYTTNKQTQQHDKLYP